MASVRWTSIRLAQQYNAPWAGNPRSCTGFLGALDDKSITTLRLNPRAEPVADFARIVNARGVLRPHLATGRGDAVIFHAIEDKHRPSAALAADGLARRPHRNVFDAVAVV